MKIHSPQITGSNTIVGTQSITGSLSISGSFFIPTITQNNTPDTYIVIDVSTGQQYYKVTAPTSGTSGAQGPSGSIGSSGLSGTGGTSGTNGTAGSGGTSGTSGTYGTAGSGGTSGTSGTYGTAGSGGTSGTNGTAGSGGTSGTNGTAGSGGTSGTNGTAGSGGTSGGFTTNSNAQVNSLGVGVAASGTTGEIRATGDITGFYSSDIRLKENISPIENSLDKIKAISGNTFDWKSGFEQYHSHTGKDVGVIAQEIQSILPEIVTERESGYLAVDYIKIIALLIEAIKEQQKQIDLIASNL